MRLFGRRFPFRDAPDTLSIACCHVLKGAPILRVTHDAEDGMWQFLCGSAHDVSQARVIALQDAWELDASIGKLTGMSCGCIAVRENRKEKGQISQV